MFKQLAAFFSRLFGQVQNQVSTNVPFNVDINLGGKPYVATVEVVSGPPVHMKPQDVESALATAGLLGAGSIQVGNVKFTVAGQ